MSGDSGFLFPVGFILIDVSTSGSFSRASGLFAGYLIDLHHFKDRFDEGIYCLSVPHLFTRNRK